MVVTIIGTTFEQEDSDYEVIICFRTKIKLTGDLTAFYSYIDFGIVINILWNSIYYVNVNKNIP